MHAAASELGTDQGRWIGYGRQAIDERDVAEVVDVLRSDWLTQGPAVERFEEGLCRLTGAPYGVAVNSGTAALQLALAGAGIGPGHTVVTSPNTFLASANAALLCGAEVEFVDVEARYNNLDLDLLQQRLEQGGVDAVVAVDFAGAPCDRQRLAELKRDFGFRLIVDGCHSLGGSSTQGQPVGSEAAVDATCFSFHPVKHVTTGEGGALVTGDSDVYRSAARLRSHGIDRESSTLPFGGQSHCGWFAPMEELGYNFRLSDMGAALGASQLQRLEQFVAERRRQAQAYREGLSGLDDLQLPADLEGHAYHLFVVHVPAVLRDGLMVWLRERRIGTQLHYYPVPLQPYYRQRYGPIEVPVAEAHARTAISLPLFPGLQPQEQERVIRAIRAFLGERT